MATEQFPNIECVAKSTLYTYIGNDEDPPVVTVYVDRFPYQVKYGDREVELAVYSRPEVVEVPGRSVIGYLIRWPVKNSVVPEDDGICARL